MFSHDKFDIIVESTDSTRSGDEPELRDDASGARSGDSGTDELLKKMFRSVMPNCFNK
jgi:hypothetical protein